ncbi:MAG: N-acetyltransferase [Planctomycetota bacterium]
MSVDVRPVAGKRDLTRFIRLPYRLYAGNPNWIAPLEIAFRAELDREKHPFFREADAEYFLARRDGRVVGRIAAVENRAHNRQQNDRAGFWGWFETEDDPEVAAALLDRAAGWLRERGLESMRGPFNPSINGPCGMLLDAWDRPPMALMPYNPPSYPKLVEAAGHEKLLDLLALLVRPEDFSPDHPPIAKLSRLAKAVRRRRPDIVYRSLDMSRYDEDTAGLSALFNEARGDNWGYVPVTDEEFAVLAKDMKPFVHPDLIILAELAGEIIGCLIAIPDLNARFARCRGRLLPFGWWHLIRNRRKVEWTRFFGAATKEAWRNSGITAVLIDLAIQNGRRIGLAGGEISWVAETNLKSLGTIQSAFGIEPYKHYRIYNRDLIDNLIDNLIDRE